MTAATHRELANFIWSICNLLRGPYKRNEYRKVILPLTVLRRFDCLLAPTKEKVLARHASISSKPETVVTAMLQKTSGYPFFNLSKLDLPKLLDNPNQLAQDLTYYINSFSKSVREIMERFTFDQQIAKMHEKNLRDRGDLPRPQRQPRARSRHPRHRERPAEGERSRLLPPRGASARSRRVARRVEDESRL